MNHKRVCRIYREERLAVRQKQRKRIAARARVQLDELTRPNYRWSMDFLSDTLATGRPFRIFTLLDEFTRDCPAIEIDTSLRRCE